MTAKLGSEKQKALTNLSMARRSLIHWECEHARADKGRKEAREFYAEMLQVVEDLIPDDPEPRERARKKTAKRESAEERVRRIAEASKGQVEDSVDLIGDGNG